MRLYDIFTVDLDSKTGQIRIYVDSGCYYPINPDTQGSLENFIRSVVVTHLARTTALLTAHEDTDDETVR